MNSILGTVGLVILLYFGTGYLPISEDHRMEVALLSALALTILGAIGQYMGKAKPTGGTSKKAATSKTTSNVPLGLYTYGEEEPALAGITYGGLKTPLAIKYCDSKGDITQRDIVIHEVSMGYSRTGAIIPIAMEAFCKLRRRERTFNVPRILECTDPVTHQPITDLGAFLAPALAEIEPYRRTNLIYDVAPTRMVVRYQFRRPKFTEKPITITSIGVYQSPNGPHQTLSYIEGTLDGKTEPQRLKIVRLAAASNPETGELIENLQAYLISRATKGPYNYGNSDPNSVGVTISATE